MLENFISIIYSLYCSKSIITGLGPELFTAEISLSPCTSYNVHNMVMHIQAKALMAHRDEGMILNKMFFFF